jgi:hypothetical protein
MAVSTEILLRARENGRKITRVPLALITMSKNYQRIILLDKGLVGYKYSLSPFITLRHPLLFYGLMA